MTSVHVQPRFLKSTEAAEGRRVRRPAHGVARLVLFINGTAYNVHPLPVDSIDAVRAFRLRKHDDTAYDVAQSLDGITCDCPDFVFNREGVDPEGCKHIKSLVSCGLIDPNQQVVAFSSTPNARVDSEQAAASKAQPVAAGTGGDVPLVPANGQPLSLLDIVEHEALGYQAWGTAAGNFLADQLRRVAQLLRWTGAKTPEDHEDRMETYDRELRDRYYDQGYHDGLEAGRRDACPCGHRHD
jgi:hypothetical protein